MIFSKTVFRAQKKRAKIRSNRGLNPGPSAHSCEADVITTTPLDRRVIVAIVFEIHEYEAFCLQHSDIHRDVWGLTAALKAPQSQGVMWGRRPTHSHWMCFNLIFQQHFRRKEPSDDKSLQYASQYTYGIRYYY